MKHPGDGVFGTISEPAPAIPDEELYGELCTWREQLARGIARNNIGMRSSRIGLLVNRQVFFLLALAVAEDRGILSRGTLRAVAEGKIRWEEVCAGFGDPWAGTGEEIRAGEPAPVIDCELIRTIAGSLALPARSLDPAGIPLVSVAAVLDRYLARTIRCSAPHQAIVVDRPDAMRPEIPTAFAEYAVERTLAAASDGRSPDDPLPLRVIDPACGAGRMLLVAFMLLKDQGGEPEELLRDTIHGIDRDPHAVAATRILLALFACGDGNRPKDFKGFSAGFREHLEILTGTVRCGNALVGPAIADDESWAFCPARERHDIRPFSWQETFPEILLPGGFDAVVSHPPENLVPLREWLRRYFQRHYAVYDPEAGLSAYVIEKSLCVLRPCGVTGIVSGVRWLHARPGTALRSLVRTRQPHELVTTGDEACFLLLENARPSRPFTVKNVGPAPATAEAVREAAGYPVDPRELSDGGWTLRDTRREQLMAKIHEGTTPLGEYVLGGIHYDPGAGPVSSGERCRDKIQFSSSGFPPRFILSKRHAAFGQKTGVVPTGSRYLYGILTSRLAGFILSCLTGGNAPGGPVGEMIARFPVKTPDFDNPSDVARHGRLEALVKEEQALARHLERARPEREREAIIRELGSTEKQINSLVYAIYGLSVDEIALVESSEL